MQKGNAKAGYPLVSMIAGWVLVTAVSAAAFASEIVGTVAESDRASLSGVRVIIRAPDGRGSGLAVTDARGQYRIAGLEPGQYLITLEAGSTNVQGQTVAAYLGTDGLTINWRVAHGLAPLAVAHRGTASSSADVAGGGAGSSWSPAALVNGPTATTQGPKKSKRRDGD